jgi:hypothetical protein
MLRAYSLDQDFIETGVSINIGQLLATVNDVTLQTLSVNVKTN